jgi:hypothetical protein
MNMQLLQLHISTKICSDKYTDCVVGYPSWTVQLEQK